MTPEQQNLCVALLVVLAFPRRGAARGPGLRRVSGQDRRKLIKNFLATLPGEDVAKAAGTPVDFSTYLQESEGS